LVLILAAVWCISCGIEAREYSPEVSSTMGDNYRRLGKKKPKIHNPDFEWPEAGHKIAELQVEGLGVIRIALYPDLAPDTVENFIRLTNQGFYNGTTFHRVIPGFMIQGGDPKSKDKNPGNDGRGGSGYRIKDEFSDAPHWRGAVAMANKGSKNSGGSQFFIVQQDSPHLDQKYSVFGRVITGMEVVDERGEMHQRGWTYFHVEGQLGDRVIKRRHNDQFVRSARGVSDDEGVLVETGDPGNPVIEVRLRHVQPVACHADVAADGIHGKPGVLVHLADELLCSHGRP